MSSRTYHLINNRWYRYLWLNMRHDERFYERERRIVRSGGWYPPNMGRMIAAVIRSADQSRRMLGLS